MYSDLFLAVEFTYQAIEWSSYVSRLLHLLSSSSASLSRVPSTSPPTAPLTLSGLNQLISAGQQFSSSLDLKWRSYDDKNENAGLEEKETPTCSDALQSLVDLRSTAENMASELEKIINPEPLPSCCYTLDEIHKVLDRAAGLPVQLEGMTQVRAKLGNLKRTQVRLLLLLCLLD